MIFDNIFDRKEVKNQRQQQEQQQIMKMSH